MPYVLEVAETSRSNVGFMTMIRIVGAYPEEAAVFALAYGRTREESRERAAQIVTWSATAPTPH